MLGWKGRSIRKIEQLEIEVPFLKIFKWRLVTKNYDLFAAFTL